MSSNDCRYEQLVAWITAIVGSPLSWETVSADASQRRYFRARRAQQTWIAVDAPPERENVEAFVYIAGLFQKAGLHVPDVLAHDSDRGFMCLTDLGDDNYLAVLTEFNANHHFQPALEALLTWQCASRPGILPTYDRATLAREMSMFKQWYITHELEYDLSERESRAIDRAFAFILDRIEAQAFVFVHRDFMPRNLMVCEPLPGIIDFQDARYGPVAYDVASLFRDAFISWPAGRVNAWLHGYWQQARDCGVPVADNWLDFQHDVMLAGAQRHLKILGLFVRIARRDGKPAYATDLERFRAYLRPVIEQFPALQPLTPFVHRQ